MRFRQARRFDVADMSRDGFSDVGLFRLLLYHGARTGLDHGDRNAPAVLHEHAGHPDLAADDVLHVDRSLTDIHGSWRICYTSRRARRNGARDADHNRDSVQAPARSVNPAPAQSSTRPGVSPAGVGRGYLKIRWAT